MEYIFAVAGLALLILAHEFGHFVIARLSGVKVDEFMVGLPGPKLFSFSRGGTRYGLTLIPFGGYVRLHGEFLDPEDPELNRDPTAFINKPYWIQILVIASGALFNFLIAIFLFAAMFIYGIPGYPTTTIDKVLPGTAAEQAGIQPGDRVLRVDSVEINQWSELVDYVSKRKGKEITLEVERSGKKIALTARIGERDGNGFLGVQASTTTYRTGPVRALIEGARMTGSFTALFLKIIFTEIWKGDLIKQSAGPVGIVVETSKAVKAGFDFYLYLLGVISINLAIINLFPVPPLDGGRIVLLLIEKVTRRKIPVTVLALIQLAGILLFAVLMFYLIAADFQRYHLFGMGN